MYYLICHWDFKCNCWMKRWNKNAFEYETCIKESQGFENLGATYSESKLKNMWFYN